MQELMPVAARRVLIVEDDYFIADDLAGLLADAGSDVAGPVATVAEAFACLKTRGRPDLALLDIRLLDGEPIFPFADALADLQVPIVFVSAYGRDCLPDRFADALFVAKPFRSEEIIASVLLHAGGALEVSSSPLN